MKRVNIRKLAAFAAAVGLTVRAERQDDGSLDFVLYDKAGEPLCTEFDKGDMAESICAWAGSHPDFQIARDTYFSEATC